MRQEGKEDKEDVYKFNLESREEFPPLEHSFNCSYDFSFIEEEVEEIEKEDNLCLNAEKVQEDLFLWNSTEDYVIENSKEDVYFEKPEKENFILEKDVFMSPQEEDLNFEEYVIENLKILELENGKFYFKKS